MKRTIILTEEQINKILNEGIEYSRNGDFANVRINSAQDDKSNKEFDTRLFGSKNNILYGDNTMSKNAQNFNDTVNQRALMIKTLKSAIEYVKNGRVGSFSVPDELPSMSKNSILRQLKSVDDNSFISWATHTLDRYEPEYGVIKGKYERAVSAGDDDKVARYHVGTVPGTALKVISLFEFNDFNVSDATKNGNIRAGKVGDKLFGTNKDNREQVYSIFSKRHKDKKIPVTYDNGVSFDLQNNFSIDYGRGADHFNRKQYGFGDESHTSVSKFMDKSIAYAAYALRKENISPDFILSAPSSSKYNIYYCQRLSEKLGVKFIDGFFKRNIINVVFNEDAMRNAGFNDEDISIVAQSVKKAAFSEITSKIASPIKEFVQRNSGVFKNIRVKKSARQFIDISNVPTIISSYIYDDLYEISQSKNYQINDNVTKIILKNCKKNLSGNGFDAEYSKAEISSLINKYCLKDFTATISLCVDILSNIKNELLSGYKPNFEGERFKITGLDKRFRPFVQGAYIIADKELNRDGSLYTRYQNSTFLIFDEDMNSGATLKLLGEAMNDKGIDDDQIICLVNAYSASGS